MDKTFIRDAAVVARVPSTLEALPPRFRGLKNPIALYLGEVQLLAGCTGNLNASPQSTFLMKGLVLFFEEEKVLQVDDILVGNISQNGSAGAVFAHAFLPENTLPILSAGAMAGLNVRVNLTAVSGGNITVRGYAIGEALEEAKDLITFDLDNAQDLPPGDEPKLLHFPLGTTLLQPGEVGTIGNTLQGAILPATLVLAIPPQFESQVQVLNPADGVIPPPARPIPARTFAGRGARKVFCGKLDGGVRFGVRLRNDGPEHAPVSGYLLGERPPERVRRREEAVVPPEPEAAPRLVEAEARELGGFGDLWRK